MIKGKNTMKYYDLLPTISFCFVFVTTESISKIQMHEHKKWTLKMNSMKRENKENRNPIRFVLF